MKDMTPGGLVHARKPQRRVRLGLLPLFFGAGVAAAAPTIPEHPLITSQSSIPLSMMVVGRDHTLFYEAYNDASDVDGDGTLDTRFKPAITYYGLFDSGLCYAHSGGSGNTDKFTPRAQAGALGVCSGASDWSGNWLNWATTSRIDALRKVFYGGHRDTDYHHRDHPEAILHPPGRPFLGQGIHQRLRGRVRHRRLHAPVTTQYGSAALLRQPDRHGRGELRDDR